MFGILYDESIGQLFETSAFINNKAHIPLDDTVMSIIPADYEEVTFIHEKNNLLDQTIKDDIIQGTNDKKDLNEQVNKQNPTAGIVLDVKTEKIVVWNLHKLFGLYGMKFNENVRHYYVNLTCTTGSIYTIEAGWHNKKVVVLVHGFGASSVYYYRIIPVLAKNYHVYAFDLYGLGLSSRPKFEHNDKHIILEKLL